MTVHCRCTYTHSKTGYVISEAFAKLEGQTSITLWGWQGKESSTVIITHTKSDERCACLSIGNDSVNPTSMHDSPSLSLSLHTGVEKNRQIEINSFFINNSQCQVAALIAIHWVSKRNAYLCPVTVISVFYLTTRSSPECRSSSEQQLFVNEENTSSKMQWMLLIREHENKFLKKDLLSRMFLCMPINHNIETTESRSE